MTTNTPSPYVTMHTPTWVVDEQPDASGHFTIRPDDHTPNGDTDAQPIATVYADEATARMLADAPALVSALRELVGYGLCRQANTHERKSLAEHYRKLAVETLNRFPALNLNHAGPCRSWRGHD